MMDSTRGCTKISIQDLPEDVFEQQGLQGFPEEAGRSLFAPRPLH
jgi:hypothetical protein